MKKKSELVHKAREYAVQAHKRIGHMRKYTNQAYDVHLKAVADMVESVTDDSEMIAAAWLHDIVEDTPATFHEIENAFGKSVTCLVSELTDVSTPSDGNRAVRKSIDRAHLSKASIRAKTIKLADIIDNCQDICRNDQKFARTFLSEVMLLMEVLKGGDDKLYKKASRGINDCATELGLSHAIALDQTPDQGRAHNPFLSNIESHNAFLKVFSAKDIADPLRSFGINEPAPDVADTMEQNSIHAAGIQQKGTIVGYVFQSELDKGSCGDFMRSFRPGQVLSSDASLTDVIQVLTRHEFCFVGFCDTVFGVIDRSDIQKPIVRMWLFGMITLIEMFLLDHIKSTQPGDKWKELISPARIEKAKNLLEERERRKHRCDLLDCLQLSDKVKIISKDKELIEALGFKSRMEVKKTMKELESLRNNLAHTQDIITHDWPQIARMTKNIEQGFKA